jgi:hypothetical protein
MSTTISKEKSDAIPIVEIEEKENRRSVRDRKPASRLTYNGNSEQIFS